VVGFAQGSGNSSKPLGPLEQTLIANTKAIPEAQKSKNLYFLKRTLTDDFLFVGSEGRLHDKEEIVESARDGELKDYYTYNLRVVPVDVSRVLHLRSAVTALPDGTVVGYPPLVEDPSVFPEFLPVPEESGAHVVRLDERRLLMASDAPAYVDGDTQIFAVKRPVSLPVLAPNDAQRAMLQAPVSPYARTPWITTKDVKVQVSWTLSNLDKDYHNIEILLDPWNDGDARELRAEGRCEGHIARQARGSGGFGYDPLFVVTGYERTMAELTDAEKNVISHRSRAVAAMRAHLADLVERRLATARRVLG